MYKVLKSLGINGEYEGIGHCVLGYIDGNYLNTIILNSDIGNNH